MKVQKLRYSQSVRTVLWPARLNAGFTLIELLVAMTLVGLIMVMLTGGLYLGKRTWEAVDGKSERVGEVRLALDFIRRQLSMARGVTHKLPDGEAPLFWGNQQMLEWVAPLPAYVGYGGLSIMRLSAVEASDRQQLVLERWFYHPQVLDGNTNSAPAWAPMLATPAWSAELPDAAVYGRHVLVEHLESLEISYFGATQKGKSPEWLEQWAGVGSFPQLLKIRLRPVGEDWPDTIFELPDPGFRFRG